MSDQMKKGDRFTIEGCGRGAKGQTVIGGVNPKTGRKCRAVALTVFVCAGPGKSVGKKKP